MVAIHGTGDSRFDPVRETLATLIDSGQDVGGSISVMEHGRPVLDIWGGFADEARTKPWEADTITTVWSTSKTVTALCALVLVDRGLLDPDAPVSRYWPEFAANGKDAVLVKHLFSHTSGVSGWDQPITIDDLYDWEASTARLAAQAPWWEPGTASGYHQLNYGHLLGEVIRRVSGKTVGQFLATEVAGPLGAEVYIGLSDEETARVSPQIRLRNPEPMDISGIDTESVFFKTLTGPLPEIGISYTDAWQRGEIPGVNAHCNARGIARLNSVITNGGEVDGVRLLSPDTIDRIFEELSNGPDLVLGQNVRWGLGYCLEFAGTPFIPEGKVAFWGGWGGSMIVNDLDRGVSIGWIQNQQTTDGTGGPSADAVISAVYSAL